MSRVALGVAAFLGVTAFVIYPDPAPAIDGGDFACTMQFGLSKSVQSGSRSEGSGIVRCDGRATLRVDIVASGAHLHDATSVVDGASGTFTRVHNVAELFGSFTDTDVARVDGDTAQILHKGGVTLTLSGGNEHVDLGSGVSELVLTRVAR